MAVAEAAELSGQWQEIMFADDRWPATQHVAEYNIVANIANLNQLQTTQSRWQMVHWHSMLRYKPWVLARVMK